MVGVVSRQIGGIETVYGGCSELTVYGGCSELTDSLFVSLKINVLGNLLEQLTL